jgi:transketolase
MRPDPALDPQPDLDLLRGHARRIRLAALEATVAQRRGHLGGTFSCTDLLVALYYGGFLRTDPGDPGWQGRDRFILSKGHACLALYAILADRGLLDRARLASYGTDGGLGGQLDVSIPGVDWNTGSLGHALGVCCGMALAGQQAALPFRAATILGDGECAEGAIWEALIFAGDRRLANLLAIVDRNRLSVTETLDDDSFFRAFPSVLDGLGWDCLEIDGHDMAAICQALGRAGQATRPTLILANTIKGRGVSFMENAPHWHHSVPDAAQLAIARRELAAAA